MVLDWGVFELEVSSILGRSASFMFSKVSLSTLGLAAFGNLVSGTLVVCCFIILCSGLVVVAGLIVVSILFGGFDVNVLLFVETATILLVFFFGSILFNGDRGLRSIFKLIGCLLCLL